MARVAVIAVMAMFAALALAATAHAQTAAPAFPQIRVDVHEDGKPSDLSTPVKILLIVTVLAIAPSILVMMTCFTRIVIVLGLLRQALGTHQVPSNQIVIGLGMFLTAFIMMPAFQQIYHDAYVPYTKAEIGYEIAADRAMDPLREFMLRQTREKDLGLFMRVSGLDKPTTVDDIPSYVVIPAFIISELKTSFVIGFMIYLPFLIIDLVIATILMSMGMMMLPPILISLPFKLLIFVLADGWFLVIGSLVQSFFTG